MILCTRRKEGRKEAVVPENMCSCMSVSVLLSKFTLHSIFPLCSLLLTCNCHAMPWHTIQPETCKEEHLVFPFFSILFFCSTFLLHTLQQLVDLCLVSFVCVLQFAPLHIFLPNTSTYSLSLTIHLFFFFSMTNCYPDIFKYSCPFYSLHFILPLVPT